MTNFNQPDNLGQSSSLSSNPGAPEQLQPDPPYSEQPPEQFPGQPAYSEHYGVPTAEHYGQTRIPVDPVGDPAGPTDFAVHPAVPADFDAQGHSHGHYVLYPDQFPPPGTPLPPNPGQQFLHEPVTRSASAKSKKKFRMALVMLSILMFLGASAVLVGLNWESIQVTDNRPQITEEQPSGSAVPRDPIVVPADIANPSEEELSVQVAQRVLPSVVSISGTIEGMGGMFMSGDARNAGAGVILKPEGYIVTNNHVIEHMSNIVVTAGAQDHPAVLIGADPSTDLAILRIDTHDLPAIELGTSSNLLEGQYVMAVGSPFGHEMSVSAGIISGLGRSNVIATQTTLTAYVDLIQTDAAINPGNSGGALVDRDGRLIGINSLINTTSGSSAGVGFAIPVDTVVHVANQLIETGSASHAFLGIGTQTITPEIARAYGFPVERGVVVNFVAGGSPADVAGISVGDFIVRIGEHSITSSEDVFSAIRSYRVGDRVEVEIYRSNENDVLEATLASDEFTDASRE